MPRENRKRGKKNKSKQAEQAQEDDFREDITREAEEDFHAVSGRETEASPFGPLDPDIKAYFRTVDEQLRDWQDTKLDHGLEVDIDPNEERRMFFTAALSEMNGKELQLATDPECSPVLERMLFSMDDFVRRVFADSLAGSWLQLITNRFASHVCQTMFTVAADTVARETRGALAPIPNSEGSGELLSMTQLVLNACKDIVSNCSNLIHNPFASHVLRALLVLLVPSQLVPSHFHSHRHAPSTRSKKSASWKARHGPMKAVIFDDPNPPLSGADGKKIDRLECSTPDSFTKMAKIFVDRIRQELDGNEVRALAVDKVASPVLQLLLEVEAGLGCADATDSIMDRVLAGLIAEAYPSPASHASPYVSALLLDATSSHLSESVLSRCPLRIFDRLWDCYFITDLPKLALHPVANFVVARGVERLDEDRLKAAATKLDGTWGKSLKLSRIGVLTAIVDRAGQIGAHEAQLVEAICSMANLGAVDDRKALVPCVLRLKTLREYHDALARKEAERKEDAASPDGPQGFRHGGRKQGHDELEVKTQGSILLQSMVRLHEPHNHVVLESLHSLLPDELLALAYNATSSRVLDAVLESPTVSLRSRKRLVNSFIGCFHQLVDDRIGSRVADRCWKAADPYLKEKIARSLIQHEQFLAGSHFGRFFSRTLNLPLLQRKPDQWKALQVKDRKLLSDANAVSSEQPKSQDRVAGGKAGPALSNSERKASKRKRDNAAAGNEIDALFNGIGSKKRARLMTIT